MDVEFCREISELLDEVPVADDLSVYRLNILRSTLFKKLKPTRTEASVLKLEAIDRFLVNNRYICENVNVSSSPYLKDLQHEFEWLFDNINFPSFSVATFLNRGRCGPGSSIGCSDDTSFLRKMFDSELTSTSWSLYRDYRNVLSERWNIAEDSRLRRHSLQCVMGSKLETVPKDVTKDRTIAIEPTLNMYAQLGAKVCLDEILLSKYNIDLSSQQELNRDMARSGSQNQRLATLDLSDASDFISTNLCKAILPSSVFNALDRIRSKYINVESHGYVPLSMFATMGNGFCFSLMTLIFSGIVCSVYRRNNTHPRNGINFAVYGDDIIVLTHLYPEIISALTSFFFRVNEHKSFSTGFFRESCGGDFYKGHSVRGIYVKKLDCAQDYYTSSNMLLSWSVEHSINLTSVISRFLDRAGHIMLVPSRAGTTGGLIIPRSLTKYLNRDRNGAIVYRSYVPISRTRRLTHRNPFGELICFLGGYIRNMRYTLRTNVTRYQIQRNVDPIWEDRKDRYFGSHFCEEAEEYVTALLNAVTLIRLERLMK